ncbi:MAG: oxygen-binding di-iron domain-containing protein [Bdellovibrionota bacterium]
MLSKVLYEDETLKWIFFGRDPEKMNEVIDTNEYIIISNGEVLMLDPGGTEIFPSVLTAVSEVVELSKIKAYLCSHQDPDIMSSLPLWMSLTPKAKIYLSWLWSGFVAHFGHEYTANFVPVKDEGMKIEIGGKPFQIVPAHHCHSPGNFSLYCPTSKILFSGDIGAALLPKGYSLFVENFEEHIQYMSKFHQRWMASNEAKRAWVRQVRKLDVQMICPQHGAIFKGEDVNHFLNWFEEIDVGFKCQAA